MIPRDHTKLICDIGELNGLFFDTSILDGFLQKIVKMISAHMHCEVCSISIYYENINELVLRALCKIVYAAKRHGKDISICGLMAHQERFVPDLLGIGIRKLSVDSRYLYKMQHAVEGVDIKDAEKEIKEILSKPFIHDTEYLLR